MPITTIRAIIKNFQSTEIVTKLPGRGLVSISSYCTVRRRVWVVKDSTRTTAGELQKIIESPVRKPLEKHCYPYLQTRKRSKRWHSSELKSCRGVYNIYILNVTWKLSFLVHSSNKLKEKTTYPSSKEKKNMYTEGSQMLFYVWFEFTSWLRGVGQGKGAWDCFLTIWAWDSCAFCNGKIKELDYWEIQPLLGLLDHGKVPVIN